MSDLEQDWKQQVIRGVREALEAAYLITADWERAVERVTAQVEGEALFMQIEQAQEVAEIVRLGRENPLPEPEARRLYEAMHAGMVKALGDPADDNASTAAWRARLTDPSYLDSLMGDRARRIEQGETP